MVSYTFIFVGILGTATLAGLLHGAAWWFVWLKRPLAVVEPTDSQSEPTEEEDNSPSLVEQPGEISWVSPLSIYLGLLIGLPVITGSWPKFPPLSSDDWLFWSVLAGAPACLLGSAVNLPGILRWLGRFVLAWGLPTLLLYKLFEHQCETREGVIWIASLGAIIFVHWSLFDPLTARIKGPLMPFTLSATYTGLSLLLVFGAVAKWAQLAGVFASVFGAIFVASLVWRNVSLARGASSATTLTAALMWIACYFRTYSEVPMGAFILAWSAPLGLWLTQLPTIKQQSAWVRWAVGLVLVFVMLGAALGWAIYATEYFAEPAADDPYSYY